MTRGQIISAARRWIGTPWAHQHSAKGIGCDCLGLVRGVYGELTGEDVHVPAYGADWPPELLFDGMDKHLVQARGMSPGLVLLFAQRRGGPARHLAIQVDSDRMVHCLERRGVREDNIGRPWRRRFVAAYGFKGMT